MYILNASVESPHMLVASVTITAITNAVVLPVLKVLHRELVNPFGILNMK